MLSVIEQLHFRAKPIVKAKSPSTGHHLDKSRSAVIDRYVSALSRDKWTRTKDIAEAIGVTSVAVTKAMKTDKMRALVRRQSRPTARTVYYVWRLK